MNSWSNKKLGDLITIKHGYAFKGNYFSHRGSHIVLTPGNFYEKGGFKIQEGKEKWYAGPVPNEYILKKGDLIVAMTEQGEGLLGSSAIIPKDDLFLHNQRLGLVKLKNVLETDQKFIYYVFNLNKVRNQIRGSASGTKVRHTSPERMYNVITPIPNFTTQQRISITLSLYDELIENNDKRIKILGEMAQRLYEEWFVKFRFPGHNKVKMVDSGTEFGLIPEGWNTRKLIEFATLVMGQSPKSEFYNINKVGFPFHQGVADFGEKYPSDRVYSTYGNRYADEGDLLFSVRAPVGKMNIATQKIILGRGLCAIRSKQNQQAMLITMFMNRFTEKDMLGNGAVYKSVNKNELESLKFIFPTVEISNVFENIVSKYLKEMENLAFIVSNLTQFRDLLIPQLVTGRKELKDCYGKT